MAPAKPLAEKKRKYFTVEEANKALPLVRAIVGDIVRQYRVVEDLQQRLVGGRRRSAAGPRTTSTPRSWPRARPSSRPRKPS